ncbi:MAG TPA: methyltransferase domain-containing protein, partial [Gemmatimonadales bacterium]
MRPFDQLRKPSGRTGEAMLRSMNDRHSALTDWGLEQVAIRATDTVLDIGCGGGRTVQKLAARAARVWGVDFSETS